LDHTPPLPGSEGPVSSGGGSTTNSPRPPWFSSVPVDTTGAPGAAVVTSEHITFAPPGASAMSMPSPAPGRGDLSVAGWQPGQDHQQRLAAPMACFTVVPSAVHTTLTSAMAHVHLTAAAAAAPNEPPQPGAPPVPVMSGASGTAASLAIAPAPASVFAASASPVVAVAAPPMRALPPLAQTHLYYYSP